MSTIVAVIVSVLSLTIVALCVKVVIYFRRALRGEHLHIDYKPIHTVDDWIAAEEAEREVKNDDGDGTLLWFLIMLGPVVLIVIKWGAK